MSGKSYTMREMKTIVEYLTENKAYSEIRGRKMWTDFANSRLTSRTWQSLKETFLKRILPDITNPYYKLSIEQIHSFKRGLDLTDKDKKKLEFKPVDEECNKDVKGDDWQPSTSKSNNEENGTGEDTTCSKLVNNRASTETLVLGNCYESAEDIQRDLEQNTDEEQENDNAKSEQKSAAKSVRDFIVYSEPLTPMLQEVLDDFATDESSDREPPMEIDESYVAQERSSDSPEIPSQSILNSRATADEPVADAASDGKGETAIITNDDSANQNVTESQEETVNNNEETTHSQLEDVMVLVDEALALHVECEVDNKTVESQEKVGSSNEHSSVMTDSLLPNNQEAVTFNSPVISTPVKEQPSNKRKHSSSIEIIETSKKIHMDTDQSILNTGEINKKEQDKSPTNGVDESNKIESPKKKHNLTLNITKDANTQSEPKESNVEKNSSHNEQVIVHNLNSDESASDNNLSSSQVINPCLKSVSLYAERFSSAKYSDSDLNEIEGEDKSKKDKIQEEKVVKAEAETEVILLKSHSDSESNEPVKKRDALAHSSVKVEKNKKLANLFGFMNGGVKRSRLSGRRRTISHRNKRYESSDSSEWTSASDSEFVSPPRGRHNTYGRKYMKPRSTRVMSLEEEGGLFVMLGKKIYPLVKDGKIAKNYLTYLPGSDPEDEDSYWKAKYVEERKRTAALKKVIEQSKLKVVTENGGNTSETKISPIAITPPILNEKSSTSAASVRKDSLNGNELSNQRESMSVEKQTPDKTVKIKFSKFDQEVQLEGHWQHINPVLAQVVSMFKEPVIKPSIEAVNCVELSSGNTTPSVTVPDPGVQDKINKIESDIFKEIEQKHEVDQEDDLAEDKKDNKNINNPSEIIEEKETKVTLRKKRGRPKKEDTPAQSPAKKSKESIEPDITLEGVGKEKQLEVKENTPYLTEKRIRTPRKLLEDANIPAKKTMTKKSSASKVSEKEEVEEEEVLYKFPSPPPEKRGRKSNINNNANELAKDSKPITSPDNSHHSVTSSQGYQDSDTSPFHMGIRRKRRLSVSTLKGRKLQRKYRSRSYPLLTHCESSNSSVNISVKSVTRETTVNSEVYRTESYQMFMPRTKTIMQRLAKINETAAHDSDLNITMRKRNNTNAVETNVKAAKSDVASSSNLSLPASPELSIVEDLSISKSALAAIKAFPTINETQIHTAMNMFDTKYLMSQVDVSMPLMAQECGLKESYTKHLMSALNTFSELRDVPNSAGRNLPTLDSSALKVSSFSEKILREFGASNIEGSPSDSLDRRLEQLLLESVKKPCHTRNPESMEVDTQVKKKKSSRRRCSTPNKKTTVQKKSKVPTVGTLVEEQSKARHARTGRRSCPPSINIVYYENNAPDNLEINIHDQKVDVTAVTKRKSIKKDVIKVKILRPKDKPQQKKKSDTTLQNVTRNTRNVEHDNESGVFLQGFDESADLIHNHSETCLHVQDCLENSIEIIETESRSIISLNSTSPHGDGKENYEVNIMHDGKEPPALFCDNAQFAVNLCDARATAVKSPESGNTCYFTPAMSQANSFMTEDLSDEEPLRPQSRASKWYLVSEEETNYDTIPDNNKRTPTYMSNLKQLFPIACAIPDLSTITEMSERNDNNKPSLDGQDATNFDSQSVFGTY